MSINKKKIFILIMSLSLTEGTAIAKVMKGDNPGMKIYMREKGRQDEFILEKDEMDLTEDIMDMLGKDYFEGFVNTPQDKKELEMLLDGYRNGYDDWEHQDTRVGMIFKKAVERYLDKLGKEIMFPEGTELVFLLDDAKYNNLLLIGGSGSGKTWLAKEAINRELKKDPVKAVHLVSANDMDDDESLEDLKNLSIIRTNEKEAPIEEKEEKEEIEYDEEGDPIKKKKKKAKKVKKVKSEYKVVNNPIIPEDYKDCVMLFDDIDHHDPKVNKALHTARDQFVTQGRKKGIITISTSHQFRGGEKTKTIISEATGIIVFPGNGNDSQIEGFIKAKISSDKKFIKKILDTDNERNWVYIKKISPCYVVHQRGVFTFK